MSLNRVCLVGRLTREPEMRYTQSGTAVCALSLAVDRKYKKDGEKQADFIDLVLWRQQAEFAANYGSKGRLLSIDGRLQTRTYETQDGQKRKVTEVVVDDLKFLDKGNGQQATGTAQNSADASWDDLGTYSDQLEIETKPATDENEIPY